MHIEHFNISAPKEVLAQLKDFYCEVFGLINGFRPDFESAGYWLYSGKNALIHLTEMNNYYQTEKPSYFDHIAFQLTGIKNLIDKLESLNVDFMVDNVPEIGMTQVFLKTQ